MVQKSEKTYQLPPLTTFSIVMSENALTRSAANLLSTQHRRTGTREPLCEDVKVYKKDPTTISVTMLEVENAISRLNHKKALGPDGISKLMLKKLGTVGLIYLTRMKNF